MKAPEPDLRSDRRKLHDEQLAAEPRLPPPDLPANARPLPMEVHLRSTTWKMGDRRMIAKKHKGERLLEIDNLHVRGCGQPPILDASGKYVGYFENPHGEQWVFIGDAKTGEAVIRGGDVGWETEHKLTLRNPCPDMILNEPEKLWLITCFMAMCHTSYDEVVTNYNQAAEELLAAVRKKHQQRDR